MAGEQLMVVDGQPQTIVVDQQQVAYQQTTTGQHVIIQETNVEQHQNREVYYMQEGMQESAGHSEAVTETPLVLNHHIQHGQLRNQSLPTKSATQPILGQQGRSSTGITQVRQQLQVDLCNLYLRSFISF